MRLHRENDDVLRARCPIVIGRSHMRHRQFTAIAHDEPNSTGPERIEISPACDESHFIAGMREPGSEVPTDRADTNDRYLQCASSIGRMQLRSGPAGYGLQNRPDINLQPNLSVHTDETVQPTHILCAGLHMCSLYDFLGAECCDLGS